MPVPLDDTVCRFVRPKYWKKSDNRPNQQAFKQKNLSVWNINKLNEYSVQIEELLIDNLTGYGQAHHTVRDYIVLALEVAREEDMLCQMHVEWRPEATSALWWQWCYAHVQVEAVEGPSDVPLELRRKLAANVRHVVAPVEKE